MSINFPNTPTVGQVFNPGLGIIYVWDGKVWSAQPGASYTTKTARRSNLVINGALNVSQENANTEGTVNVYYAADQFYCQVVASGAAYGFGRIAAANPSGSQNRLRFRVTTAKASLAAGDVASFVTRLEGLNVQDLAWSVAGQQKDAVLSFGFNGPAGTYSVAVRNVGGGTQYAFLASFTVTAGQANTDTAQVIKVPAPAGLTSWAVDNTGSVDLSFAFAAGSSYLAAAGWNSGNFLGVTGMSNGLAAVQSFQIWDFYFGADPDKTGVPPSFEVPDFATEQAKCMRYWEKQSQVLVVANTNLNQRSWLASKRASPSLGLVPNSGTGAAIAVTFINGWYQSTAHNAAVQADITGNARM